MGVEHGWPGAGGLQPDLQGGLGPRDPGAPDGPPAQPVSGGAGAGPGDRTAPEGLAPFLLETRAPQGGRLRGRSETCSPSPSKRSIWTIRACSLEAIAAPEAELTPEVQGHLLSSWYLFSPPPAPSLQITYTFPRKLSSDGGRFLRKGSHVSIFLFLVVPSASSAHPDVSRAVQGEPAVGRSPQRCQAGLWGHSPWESRPPGGETRPGVCCHS